MARGRRYDDRHQAHESAEVSEYFHLRCPFGLSRLPSLACARFLQSTECKQLYLVGDIVDIWAMKNGVYWPEAHNQVVREVLGKAERGTEVIYTPGNHDELFRTHLGARFRQRRRARRGDSHHGRRSSFPGDAWRCVRRRRSKRQVARHDRLAAYDGLLMLNGLVSRIRRAARPGLLVAGRYLKQKVKNAVSYIGNFEAAVAGEAERRQVDGMICGHIHHAEMREIAGVAYCNCGDWVESCTALVEHHDGRLELLRWTDAYPRSQASSSSGWLWRRAGCGSRSASAGSAAGGSGFTARPFPRIDRDSDSNRTPAPGPSCDPGRSRHVPRSVLGDCGVAEHDSPCALGEARVLRIGERDVVGSFQLDPDRKVVAALPPFEPRDAGVPGALLERRRTAGLRPLRRIKRCAETRRPAIAGNRGARGIEASEKEIVDPFARKVARRQADVVDHQQIDVHTRRAVVLARRGPSLRAGEPALAVDARVDADRVVSVHSDPGTAVRIGVAARIDRRQGSHLSRGCGMRRPCIRRSKVTPTPSLLTIAATYFIGSSRFAGCPCLGPRW
jgi:UDP-2,3-diacylglucosamine pyrophosphatase LpxH